MLASPHLFFLQQQIPYDCDDGDDDDDDVGDEDDDPWCTESIPTDKMSNDELVFCPTTHHHLHQHQR